MDSLFKPYSYVAQPYHQKYQPSIYYLHPQSNENAGSAIVENSGLKTEYMMGFTGYSRYLQEEAPSSFKLNNSILVTYDFPEYYGEGRVYFGPGEVQRMSFKPMSFQFFRPGAVLCEMLYFNTPDRLYLQNIGHTTCNIMLGQNPGNFYGMDRGLSINYNGRLTNTVSQTPWGPQLKTIGSFAVSEGYCLLLNERHITHKFTGPVVIYNIGDTKIGQIESYRVIKNN